MPKLMVSEIPGKKWIEDGIFAVAEVAIEKTMHGKPYLSVRLSDVSGQIKGIVWDCDKIPDHLNPGSVVSVKGQYNSQYHTINIASIEPYDGPIEPSYFLPKSRRDSDEMRKELEEYCYNSGKYKQLLVDIFEEIGDKFFKWPGAVEVHHAYIGGLAEHTLAVTDIARCTAQMYRENGYNLNLSLITAGALLHDVGKLETIECDVTIRHNEKESLYGHVQLGAEYVKRAIGSKLTEKEEQELMHIILSHQLEREWGAAVRPATPEAAIVAYADYMDSKLNRYFEVTELQKESGVAIGPHDKYLRVRPWAPDI